MKLEIEHKIALVTASSGGIELEIARSLAPENAKVVINGLHNQMLIKQSPTYYKVILMRI